MTSDAAEGRAWATAAAVIAALTLFRLWAAAEIPLTPDETYYWLWSRVPAAGYYDHPPMVAWWIWASTTLFGDGPLAVRAPAVIAAALTSWALYATARNLGLGAGLPARTALWFNATILVGVGAILITPDAPSVLFWALAVWALAVLRRTGEGWRWLLVGLFAGLGCASKYTGFFLGIGVILWLLADRDARRWFLSPWLWLGGLVALLVFLPVLMWNADNGWLSFQKQFGRIGADASVQFHRVAEFIGGQFGLLNPLIAVFVGVGLWRAARAILLGGSVGRGGVAAFLLFLSAPLIVYLLFHSLRSSVQGNWLAPAYPALVALAVIAAAGATAPWLRGGARLAAPVGIALSVLILLYFMAPVPTPFGQRTPAERFTGWAALADEIEAMRAREGATWIATADYNLTGELAYYGAGPEAVHQITERQRYLFDTVAPEAIAGPALLVLPERRARPERFASCFATLTPLGSVERLGPDGPVATYRVWLATGARKNILRRGCR